MRKVAAVAAASLALGIVTGALGPVSAGELKLPPEVTPALKAACESDARRLCIREASTIETVKQCMLENFMRLGNRCRMQITLAGLAP